MLKKVIWSGIIAVALYFLKKYMSGCAYQTDIRLDGKVTIVTGANTGLGKETAIDFAGRGGKVYMGSRSLERGQQARDDVLKVTGAQPENVVLLKLDLGSLASIREFSAEFKKREKKLDILVNNAGVANTKNFKTTDGFEMTFGVNHLGHFLLTNLLADELIAGAPSRVVTVSSLMHLYGEINFDTLMTPEENTLNTYGNSKLANVLFAKELATRLKEQGVTSYSLHPGSVQTDLTQNIPVFNWPYVKDVLLFLLSPVMKDVWHGARTQVYLSLEPGLEKHNGKYFSECAVTAPKEEAFDDDLAKKLWEYSLGMVKLTPDETHPALRA